MLFCYFKYKKEVKNESPELSKLDDFGYLFFLHNTAFVFSIKTLCGTWFTWYC